MLRRSEVPALYRTVARITPDFRPVTYGISRKTGDAMTHRYVKCTLAAEYWTRGTKPQKRPRY